jgi:outer membrane protein TolC
MTLAAVISLLFAREARSDEFISLDAFLDMVVSGNNMLAAEAKAVESAYFDFLSSAASQRPSFGVAVAGSYLSGQEQDGGREADIGGFEVRLEAVQPIDISGRFGIEERQAALSFQMRRESMKNAANSLLADAEESYWSAVFAGENSALQREVLLRRMENRRITEEKYRRELVPKLDVIRADALVLAAEALVAQADAERLNILAAMTSMTGGAAAPPGETLSVPPLFEADFSLDMDAAQRPDVRAGKFALEMAANAKELTARKTSPTLEASASWVPFSGPSGSSSPQKGEAVAALRLSIPILKGSAAKYENLSAAAAIQSAEASLRHALDAANAEISAAENNWAQAVVTERAKKSEMERSNEELRITELMYREGLGAQTDMINAQIENQKVRTDYLTAVKDMRVAIVRLRESVGGYAARFGVGINLKTPE